MTYMNITDYLEALITIFRGEQRNLASELSLQQVHMQIIHYLGRCNRYSDSFLTLCDYLGQTKGSLSTSVSLLEKKALVYKKPDDLDKRKSHLQLTKLGTEVYNQQNHLWEKALVQLTGNDKKQITSSLQLLLKALQKGNNNHLFGVCAQCKHLTINNNNEEKCGLTQEILYKSDLDLICVFYAE